MGAHPASDATTTTFDEKSFSVRTVPQEWLDAEETHGPKDTKPLPSKRMVKTVPIGTEADVITGTLAALAMSVVAGVIWYAFESQDVLQTPWAAIPVGVLIAVGVRLGSGADHSDVRATISVIFYTLTVFVVAYFIERYDYIKVYGEPPGFAEAQTELVRDRFTRPEVVVGWALGMLAVVQTGYLLRRRSSSRF